MGQPPWLEDERSERLTTARGEVAIWFPAPLVIVYKYKGYSEPAHARFIEETFERAYGPDQRHIHLFVDTEAATGYDPEFRRMTGARAARLKERTDTYCLLVKSRIIGFGINLAAGVMGVARANGLGGRFLTVSNREDFNARIAAAVRHLPPP